MTVTWREILFFLILFGANLIQAITGFAGTLLAMPPSMQLLGVDEAKSVLAVLDQLSCLLIVLTGFRHINWKEFGKMAVLMVVGMFAGMKIFEAGNISTIDLKGFQSTSRSFDVACGFAGNDGRSAIVYKITVPKGKHALDVSAVSHNPDEQEVLLPPTGKYRIDKVYYEKDDDGFIIRQIVEVTYE